MVGPMLLRESAAWHTSEAPWSERHLHCVWADPNLRPATLVTRDGEPLVVESPGRWNLEAGPDFLDSVLRVGKDQRRLVGDTEVHVRPADWRHHGHDHDARYRRVILHVTYFPDARGCAGLPDHVMQLALNEPLHRQGLSALDDIDILAYPHAALSDTPRPCRGFLEKETPDFVLNLLTAAGRWRLAQKSARMGVRLRESGSVEQTFYEEVMRALGYKHNRQGFRRLALRYPLHAWQSHDPEVNYAMLLGIGGLLPPPDAARDGGARAFLRRLWDHWWRNAPDTPCMKPQEWHLSSIRPMNHPRRRLAAAAALFSPAPPALLEALLALDRHDAPAWHRQARQLFHEGASMAYWDWHPQLTGPAYRRKAPALLGPARIAAMLANVVIPLIGAQGHETEALFTALPGEQSNSVMRETATRLLGRDHNPALYRSHGVCQQGLMQVYQDFCLNTRDGCRECRLVARLAASARADAPTGSSAGGIPLGMRPDINTRGVDGGASSRP